MGLDGEEICKWTMDATSSWKDQPTHHLPDTEREEAKMAPPKSKKRPTDRRLTEVEYWMDYRNASHDKLSWTTCVTNSCPIHYSDKNGAGWNPRPNKITPRCKWSWFECTTDTCPVHLWDKRTASHFPGHVDPQEILQMQSVQEKDVGGQLALECDQDDWYLCLHPDCDKHMIAKDFHGFGKAFLDQDSRQKELARRLTA